eukprot:TRINITY_DN22520_c0_g1_i1.p1 TRINITY_DN22520_c0_g1~~TRINITY_DN22520_c0_g1_i1.p1  ORF type:complete len:396 (+),score=52.58 TRINITY_DN22520_c0_g1_i1:80-1267(+)
MPSAVSLLPPLVTNSPRDTGFTSLSSLNLGSSRTSKSPRSRRRSKTRSQSSSPRISPSPSNSWSPRKIRVAESLRGKLPPAPPPTATPSARRVPDDAEKVEPSQSAFPCALALSAKNMAERKEAQKTQKAPSLNTAEVPQPSPSQRSSLKALSAKDVTSLSRQHSKDITSLSRQHSKERPSITSESIRDQRGLPENAWDMVVSLARQHLMPVKEVRRLLQEFRAVDVNGDGSLSLDEFEFAIRKRYDYPEDADLPEDLLLKHWKWTDRDCTNEVDFPEFMRWMLQTEWTESLLVPVERERQLRSISRDMNLRLPDVEYVRKLFDKYDIDRNDSMDRSEFNAMICEILHLDQAEVTAAQLHRYWNEAIGRSGISLSFEDFVKWYFNVMIHYLEEDP